MIYDIYHISVTWAALAWGCRRRVELQLGGLCCASSGEAQSRWDQACDRRSTSIIRTTRSTSTTSTTSIASTTSTTSTTRATSTIDTTHTIDNTSW